MSSWSGWNKGMNIKTESGFMHILLALGEGDPDQNHIHMKKSYSNSDDILSNIETDFSGFILCSVKVNGVREISRRELCEQVNNAAGLNLQYR